MLQYSRILQSGKSVYQVRAWVADSCKVRKSARKVSVALLLLMQMEC